MKNVFIKTIPGICLVLFSATVSAQKIIAKENFQLVRPAVKLNFTPFSKEELAKNAAAKTETDQITLPNNKKVQLKDYLKSINFIEKNLSDLGYARNRVEKTIVLSRLKSTTASQAEVSTLTVKPLLSKTSLTNRFALATSSNIQAIAVSRVEISDKIKGSVGVNPALLPNDTITVNENFNIPKFNVAGHGVKIDAAFTMKGIVDPFNILDRQKHVDSLNKVITSTTNEYSLGFNINVGAEIPQLGAFSVYKIESQFSTKANGSIRSKAQLKVMNQVLIDEDKTVNTNKYAFVKNQVFNTSKMIGAADVFMYGLNFLSPVDFYLSSNAIGGDFDVTITKSNVSGTMGPIITQSIFMEASVTELLGPGGELIHTDVVDAGVGGELRLVEGGFDFGGKIGLAIENGSLVLKNDVYKAIDVKLLRGRLYTYYSYPRYVCDNIFGVLDPNCWNVVRIENNIFDSGSALKFQKVLFDENNDKRLDW